MQLEFFFCTRRNVGHHLGLIERWNLGKLCANFAFYLNELNLQDLQDLQELYTSDFKRKIPTDYRRTKIEAQNIYKRTQSIEVNKVAIIHAKRVFDLQKLFGTCFFL